MFYFPPFVQRFLRGKTWWDIIKYTPTDTLTYCTVKHPGLGIVLLFGGYYYYWTKPIKTHENDRIKRWRENWRANVHIQESIDFPDKQSRDEMKEFILTKKAQFGSFEKALKAYEDKTGKKAPPILTDDIVLDYALKRIGVDINDDGNDEPKFLWDGTGYLNDRIKPLTFADGKHAIPRAPTFYLQ
mmetsp:Transcript_76692/g.94146  ORF Transcript_76692/g.94146 Transcript_76692/m.94146 type:complete len:186 (+) Transcript_76692:1-558(+)